MNSTGNLRFDMSHYNIDINLLSRRLWGKVQEITDKYHKKICDSGVMMLGKLYPPKDSFIAKQHEWCHHDIVNMLIKETNYGQNMN